MPVVAILSAGAGGVFVATIILLIQWTMIIDNKNKTSAVCIGLLILICFVVIAWVIYVATLAMSLRIFF